MARHQKSLLEAFQSANDEREGGDPASAGPFAGSPTSALRSAEPRNLIPAVSARDSRFVLLFVGWGILAFVVGVVAGLQFAPSETVASGSGASLADSIRAVDAEWQGSLFAAGREVNEALNNSENRYTVVALSFLDEGNNRELAWNYFDDLSNLGLPAGDPVLFEDSIYILAGAAPEAEDLATLERHLHATELSAGGGFPFAEAYVIEISRIL